MTDPSSRSDDLGGQATQVLSAAEEEFAAAATTAARLVQRAGTILEEELSVGIAALDRLENRFVDVERIRDPETHDLLNRFRGDAHQIVDLLLDVVGTSFDALNRVADGGISIGVPLGQMSGAAVPLQRWVTGDATGSVSVLDAAETVVSGGTASLSMAVTNSSDSATETFLLVASDLISGSGSRIPAGHVTFDPTTLTIPANSSERVAIEVRVPDDAIAGTYAGLVQATNLDKVRAVLTISVT